MSKWVSYTEKDFYNYYIDNTPDGIDYKRFKALLVDYYKLLAEQLLGGVNDLKLPHNLGTLRIVKYKPKYSTCKKLAVDFKSTKELGKRVYHLNQHSDGFSYKLLWQNAIRCHFCLQKYYVNLVRANKRELAQRIKNNINDFIEI